MPSDPSRKEGLSKSYPPVVLNYPLVPKFIATPDLIQQIINEIAQHKKILLENAYSIIRINNNNQ